MVRPSRRRQAAAIPAREQASRPAVGRLAPWLLLVGVLAVKVALALTLAGHPLLQPEGELDAGEYWRLAERVAGGDLLLQGTPFYVSPLYIYWLALAAFVTGGSVAGVLVLQAVIGTVAVWLTAQTAALWVADDRRIRAALVAGGSLALTSVVALQEALILQSALDAALIGAFALALTRALQQPSLRAWTWCGAAMALLAVNRPNAWLLAALCLPAAVWAHSTSAGAPRASTSPWRRLAVWGIGVAVVLLPFTIRTALATGTWQILPAHGGLNFYIGNHAAANGTYTVVEGIRPSIEGQRLDMHEIAVKATGRPMAMDDVSWFFVRGALDWWRASPAAALRLLTWKLWLATHAWELPINVSHAWFREQTVLLWLMPVGAWLLLPLGLGTVVAGHLMVPDAHRTAWRWFRWVLPLYLLSVALFFVVDRYRMPALVIGAIHVGVLASMSRAQLLSTHRRSVWLAMALATVVFLGGVVSLPFQRGEADADTQMAVLAIAAGRDDDGERWLARAVARHPAPGIAWFRAGLAWQARNDLPRAERALRAAHRLDPEVADLTFALAGVLLSQGKGGEALPLLETIQAAGDGKAPTAWTERVRLDVALAHWQAGNEGDARRVLSGRITPEGLPLLRARALAAAAARHTALAEWLLSVYRHHAPADAEVTEKLGLVVAQRGDTAAAAALFEDAARLDPTRATARFNLAIARLQQGRRSEAIDLLREALRLDPTYSQAAGALRELLGTP